MLKLYIKLYTKHVLNVFLAWGSKLAIHRGLRPEQLETSNSQLVPLDML